MAHSSSIDKFDIGIVGAGLVGSAFALWLSKNTDYSVCLIERNEPLARPDQPNERVVALGALASNYLQQLGVFQQLGSAAAYAYQTMQVWDDNSDGELGFDAQTADQEHLGFMVDSPMCNFYLQQALLESDVSCFFNSDINKLEQGLPRSSLLFEHQHTPKGVSCKLLVAADGARSWLRQQAKIFANHYAYGQHGVVATIETELSHKDCAWQVFLDTGPLAILPLANKLSSIVWSADDARASDLMELSENDFEQALSHALKKRLGKLVLKSDRKSFPLQSVQAERYFAGNIVLIGDAAHSIHPMAGQGANLGFKDAVALGELLLSAHASEMSKPSLLAKYQSQRQADNKQTDLLMTSLHHTYRSNSPLFMMARGLGMNLLNRSNVMRRALVAQAIGLN